MKSFSTSRLMTFFSGAFPFFDLERCLVIIVSPKEFRNIRPRRVRRTCSSAESTASGNRRTSELRMPDRGDVFSLTFHPQRDGRVMLDAVLDENAPVVDIPLEQKNDYTRGDQPLPKITSAGH